jgi:thymidylate synthase (FAD)
MCELKLHVRVPMDCWRQWIRHRTANVNEYSTRYSLAIDSTQKTNDAEWRRQSSTNKQGSEAFLDREIGRRLSQDEEAIHNKIRKVYDDRIQAGVAREQARKDLPLSTYTEAFWKIDLHNLFHFLELRLDIHAQTEIRSYANVIGNQIVKVWCPMAWEAFCDYRLNAMRLSDVEVRIARYLLEHKLSDARTYLISLSLLSFEAGRVKVSRELREMEVKLKRLGLEVDWETIE